MSHWPGKQARYFPHSKDTVTSASCMTKLGSKFPVLKTEQALDKSQAGKKKLRLNRKCLPCWLAFGVSEDALWAASR